MDFDIRTTADIPESQECPLCGARHWLHYYCAEEEEIGLMCGSCLIHFRDEEESQCLAGTYCPENSAVRPTLDVY